VRYLRRRPGTAAGTVKEVNLECVSLDGNRKCEILQPGNIRQSRWILEELQSHSYGNHTRINRGMTDPWKNHHVRLR